MDELFAENIVDPPKEMVLLQADLLENENELYNLSVYNEEIYNREIQVLRETLYQFFRQIDTDDLGMISHNECLEVLQLLNIILYRYLS